MTMKTTTATFALLAGTAAAFTPPEYAPSAPSFVTRTDNSSLSDATGEPSSSEQPRPLKSLRDLKRDNTDWVWKSKNVVQPLKSLLDLKREHEDWVWKKTKANEAVKPLKSLGELKRKHKGWAWKSKDDAMKATTASNDNVHYESMETGEKAMSILVDMGIVKESTLSEDELQDSRP